MGLTKTDAWGGALGGFAAISQVVLLREALSVAGGNELSAAVSFVGWFFGVAAGALLARHLKRFFSGFVFASALSCASVFLGLVILRLHRLILHVGVGEDPSLLGISAVLLAGLGLGGLTAGSLFTMTALRLRADDKSPVSRLYAAESAGAVIGAAAFALLFVSGTAHLVSLGVAAAFLFGGAALMSDNTARRFLAFGAAAFFWIAAFIGGLSFADFALEKAAFTSLRRAPLIASEESAYGRLSLSGEAGQYELLVDGRFDHTFPDPYDRPVPVHLALTEHPHPDDVLIVGGGPTDRLEAALAHHSRRVVMTYLNDKIEDMCRPFWPRSTLAALADSGVETVQDDGRRYISRTSARFDVVIVFAKPPRSAGENRFHTQTFYQAVSRILKAGGQMTAVAPGSANVLSKEAAFSAASALATIRSVFQETLIIPGLDTLILASENKGALTADPAILADRYIKRGIHARSFSARRFADLLDQGRLEERLSQLHRVSAKINTDDMPVVYSANLSLWERTLGGAGSVSSAETLTGIISRRAPLFFVVPVLLMLLLRVSPFRKGPSFAARATAAVAVTGSAGMAVQTVVLLAFQAAFGTLYRALALLTGMFMLGLTVGAFIGRRYLARGRPADILVADATLMLFLAATGPVLRMGVDHTNVFYIWSMLAGAITGAAFPVFLGLAAREVNRDERPIAASIETADHLGAAFGAFVTGVVWLPCFGIAVTCLLFAGLKLASTAFCLGGRRTLHSYRQ